MWAFPFYLFSLLLFGLNGIVASTIPLESSQIVFLRLFIGSFFLLAILLLSKKHSSAFRDSRTLGFLCLSGICLGISWLFLYEAYVRIGVSLATLAYYCGPIIVMALSPFVFKQRIGLAKWIALCIVVLGMVFAASSSLQYTGSTIGVIYGIGSAFFYAGMVIFNKKAGAVAGIENATVQLLSGCVLVGIYTAYHALPSLTDVVQNLTPILWLGVINTGIGCWLYFFSIQRLSADAISIFGYLEPLSALLFAALILDEQLSGTQILGACLIFAGAASAQCNAFSPYSRLKVARRALCALFSRAA